MFKTIMLDKKICFIGFGNSIRSDDCLGLYIISLLEQKLGNNNNFTFMTLPQIDPALAPLLGEYDEIIFIDAAVDIDNEFIFENIFPTRSSGFTTHVFTLTQLMDLAGSLYRVPVCSLMRVHGYEFGFGEKPSKKGELAALCAVDAIHSYLYA